MSQRAKDEVAIRQAILDYYMISNKVSMDPQADIDLLRDVAAGQLLKVDLSVIEEWRAKGWRSTKPVIVENLAVTSIEQHRVRATAAYCVNSTGVDVLDPGGKSQVVEGRPNLFPTITLLEKWDNTWLPVRERAGGSTCND